ncbi:MAG: hypothetical protein BIFFINMI_04234 [Phycisphaerae bacterium]|nr:hypothetical protein [Phycisphaerae bacterium]
MRCKLAILGTCLTLCLQGAALRGQDSDDRLAKAQARLPRLPFAAADRAKPVADLADLLPADTLVYASWCGQDAIHAAYLQSDFRRFWDEPSLAGLRAQIVKVVAKEIADMENKEAVATAKAVWDLAGLGFRRPIAVALLDPSGEARKRISQDGPIGAVVLMLDVGPAADDQKFFSERIYKPLLGVLLADLMGSHESLDVASRDVGGVRLTVARWKDEDNKDARESLCWGVSRNVFFLAFNESSATRVAESVGGKAGALGRSAAYQSVAQKWGHGSALTRSFVDVAGVGRLLGEAGAEEEANAGKPARVLDALGLDQAVYGGSIRYDGQAVVANRFVAAPATNGIFFPFQGRALSNEELALVPADAAAGVVCRLLPGRVYLHAKQRITLLQSTDDAAADGGMKDVARDLMVTMALGLFTDCGVLIAYENENLQFDKVLEQRLGDMMGGGEGVGKPTPPPDVKAPFDFAAEFAAPAHLVFKWKVNNPEAARKMGAAPAGVVGQMLLGCFDGDVRKLPPPRKYQVGDRMVEYMRDQAGGQVAWVYDADFLIVSNTIRGVLKTLEATPEKSAVRLQGVSRYLEHRPGDATCMVYVNIPRVVNVGASLTNKVLDMVKAQAGEKLALDARLDPAKLGDSVTPVVIWIAPHPEGLLIREVGSASATGFVLGGAPAAGAAFMVAYFQPFAVMGGQAHVAIEAPATAPDEEP